MEKTLRCCLSGIFALGFLAANSMRPLCGETPEIPSDYQSSLDLEPVTISDVLIEESSVSTTVSSGEQDLECAVCEPSEFKISFGDWVGYNATQSNTTWLAGGDFGMFSMESYPALKLGRDSAVMFGSGFHFLDGPRSPDMPPRLFDFQMAYQARKPLSPRTMLDVRLGVGAFSDFEGSARKGIRFPGHVVSYHECSPDVASVFGVEVLDRDDISVLPVAGAIWRPYDDLVLECVFPRPRAQLRLSSNRAMYFGGELGGGTWAIKRDDKRNDNATYRDLRVTWGITSFDDDDDSTLEIGWAFDRSLEYRSGLGNTNLDGAFLLRWHKHF
ncbi:MAG: hypothetical protein KDB00_20115 [Planctomycetales bacterium]|nr:hypothetical protein [Planctomycetales bacterium]